MRNISKLAFAVALGLALAFTQVTVFAQPQPVAWPPAPPPAQPFAPSPAPLVAPPPAQPVAPPPAQPVAWPPAQPVAPQPVQPIEPQPVQQFTPQPAQPVEPTTNAASDRKNYIALDEFTLIKGLVATNDNITVSSFSFAYERLMAPHFSLGSDLDLYIAGIKGASYMLLYFSLASEGRYYTDSDFEKFFIGTTFGFNLLSAEGISAKKGGFIGLTTSLKMGYKVVYFESFCVEPSMSWVLSKMASCQNCQISPLGWQGGLRLGYSF